jgi:hypothetical protein
MRRKRYPPDDPREWLNRARSNLALARAVVPDVLLEDLCFDAQLKTDEKQLQHAEHKVPRPAASRVATGQLWRLKT